MWYPDTNEVRTAYRERWSHQSHGQSDTEFDAWLESVREEAKIEALGEALGEVRASNFWVDEDDINNAASMVRDWLTNLIEERKNVKGIQSE